MMTDTIIRIYVFMPERMIYLFLKICKRKKVIVIVISLALVLLAFVVWILFDKIFIYSDPSTTTIDRQIVESALNDMKSTLTEKDYEMMLIISKDWEENTDGESI